MIHKDAHALRRARGRRRLVAIATLELARRHAESTGDLTFPDQGGRHRREDSR